MSSLTILAPAIAPPPQAAPGKLVDVPTSARPGDVPRAGVIVQLSEQVRELTDTEKQETDERSERFGDEELTDEQERDVQELKKTDREVRSHEAAHKAAAGAYARGAAQFETVVGPDGRRYAVGGEVAIDASAVSGNPEATVRKMEQVARAALAPADPSAQDRSVASQARQTGAEARRDIILERAEQQKARNEETDETNAENRLDAPAETEEADEPSALDVSENASGRVSLEAPSARDAAEAAQTRAEVGAHGHGAQDSCPLCLAQGAPTARVHGGLDRSA